MDAYPDPRGLFASFSLLLVLGTLVGQILASPLPLSADTAILHKRNYSSEINSSNSSSSLSNQEHSEVASLNERGLSDLVSDNNLFLGVGFVVRSSIRGSAIPLDQVKIPWKSSLKSKSDMYLLPNTKLAKPFLDDAQFKQNYRLCLVYGSKKKIGSATKIYTTYETHHLAHPDPPPEYHRVPSGDLPDYHETLTTPRPLYNLIDQHPPYTTTEPESIGKTIVFAHNQTGPANDIVMRIPVGLWPEMVVRVANSPSTLTGTSLKASWKKWKIQGWPKGLKARGDGEDDDYE